MELKFDTDFDIGRARTRVEVPAVGGVELKLALARQRAAQRVVEVPAVGGVELKW